MEEMKHYYNCDAVQGVFMENEGDAGSAVSHFERTIFGPEIMTSST